MFVLKTDITMWCSLLPINVRESAALSLYQLLIHAAKKSLEINDIDNLSLSSMASFI